MFILEDMSLEQLSILGVTFEYQILIGSVLTSILLYALLKPMTLFLHYRHYTIVLTYVISSLLMFMMFTMFTFVKGDINLLRIGFQAMAIYGICTVLFIIYRKIKYAYSR